MSKAPFIFLLNMCILLTYCWSSRVQCDCGFPGIPSGIQVSRDTLVSLTYSEGKTIHASCAFTDSNHNKDYAELLEKNGEHFVFPTVSVNYTLQCSQTKQWITQSLPEGIPWRSCPSTAKRIPVQGIRATSLDDSFIIPVFFENDRSNCYSSILDIPQKWFLQFDYPVTPCFLSIELSTSSRMKINLRTSELRVLDNSGYFNCYFMSYAPHPLVKHGRRRIQAQFVCRVNDHSSKVNQRQMTSLTLEVQEGEKHKPRRQEAFSFFSQVSICGVHVQECDSSCGSFPLPLKATLRKERMLETNNGDKSLVKYSCGESNDGSTVIETSSVYDELGGLVCLPDGSWSSPPPQCLSNQSDSIMSLLFNFLSIPSDCVSCVSLVCLFLLLMITGVFLVIMIILNYVWMRKKKETDFIQGRESLLWIRKHFLSNSIEVNPWESLMPSSGSVVSTNSQSKKKTRHHQKRKKEQPTSSLLKCNPCHSYINMQENLFDSDLKLPLGTVMPGLPSTTSTFSSMSSLCSTISAPETVNVIHRQYSCTDIQKQA